MLDADEMRCTLGPSTVTLGGLVKHLALLVPLAEGFKVEQVVPA